MSAGAALAACVEGEGEDVVLLHGFTGSAETLADTAAALRPPWRTVRLDLPGHGSSPAPSDPARYALPACVAWLAATLDALGVGRAHLLGYSLGGRVALGFAVAHPERVRSLVLVGASAGLASAGARAERRRADEALADRIEREGLPAFVEHWMSLPLFESQRRLGPAFLARARQQRLAQRPEGLAASLRGIGSGAQPALHAELARLHVPTLLVAGAEDPKFAAIAEDLARRLPDARCRIVPGTGHAVHLERPDEFHDAVRRFLAEPAAAQPRGTDPTPADMPRSEEERA